MKVIAVAAMATLAYVAQAKDRPQHGPPVLEKLCGKLAHYAQIPVKNTSNVFTERTRPLRQVSIRLYRADTNRPCCSELSLVGETKTGHWGSFHLKEKGLPDGQYWIVVQQNSREYRLPVRYAPRKSSTQLCSQTLFELDDAGNMWKTETVFVD